MDKEATWVFASPLPLSHLPGMESPLLSARMLKSQAELPEKEVAQGC